MNYKSILMVCAILTLAITLAGCGNSTNTAKNVVVTPPADLGTNDNVPKVNVSTSNASDTSLKNSTDIKQNLGFDNPAVPKVSVDTVELLGSRFGTSRFTFSRIQINYSVDIPLDYTKLKFAVGNKFFNGTLTYNSSFNCSDLTNILKNRNKAFAVTGNSTQGSICLSPARDLGSHEEVSVIGTYSNDSIIIQENIALPGGITKPYLRLK